jgi:large subunit ribosomal protein L21
MYAIIETGGKQYRITPGDIIDVELLNGEEGSDITFPKVIFFHDGSSQHIGAPHLSSVTVTGKMLGEAKGPKIASMKYKRSHHQYRRFGHRQHYSRIEITGIASQHHEGKKKH